MATTNHISMFKGESVGLVFTVDPLTDITGWTITMTVRANATDTAALLSVGAVLTTPASGIFTCSLTHAQTMTTLGVGTFAYDVQRTDSTFEAVLSIGNMDVVQEVLFP